MKNISKIGMLALALSLAACGGGGSSSSGSVTPTTQTYTVSTSAGEGTSFSPSTQTVEANKTASASVTLAAGYKDLRVTGCGVDFSKADAGTYTITPPGITAACTLAATATKIPTPSAFTVTLIAGEGTTFTGSTSVSVNPGNVFNTTARATFGYNNLHVTGCGVDVSSPSTTMMPITTPVITANCTLTASATRITSTDGPYMLYGIGQSTSADFAHMSDSFTITAQAAGKFAVLKAVILDGVLDGTTSIGKQREVVMTSTGNGVYTAKISIPSFSKLYGFSGQEGALMIYVRAYDASGNEITKGAGSIEGSSISHAIIDSSVPAPTMTACAPNASRNGNIVNVVGDIMDLNGRLEALRSCVDSSQIDFIMQFPTGAPSQYTGGYSSAVTNEVEGIGLNAFTQVPNGFPRLRSYQTIGMPVLDCSGQVCLHEVMHTWGFYLKKDGVDLTGGGGIHVGPSNVDGMLGTSTYLRIEADGSATVDETARPNSGRYDPLEQYLAGWRDASEVPARYFAVNKSHTLAQGTKIPKSDLVIASPDWIASQFGAHKNHSGAPFQKDFNMVMVVISSAPLTPAEVAHFSLMSRHFEGTSGPEKVVAPNGFEITTDASFYYATEGRATMKTRVIPKP